jgi:hypothetical protein
MAELRRLVNTKDLKSTLWKKTIEEKGSHPCLSYDAKLDVLTMLIVPKNTRKIVHYIDEHVAFLYLLEDKEIVGLRIESFRKSFLPEYSELQKVWKFSNSGNQILDFGDLAIVVQKESNKVYRELSRVTGTIAKKQGIELPVPT